MMVINGTNKSLKFCENSCKNYIIFFPLNVTQHKIHHNFCMKFRNGFHIKIQCYDFIDYSWDSSIFCQLTIRQLVDTNIWSINNHIYPTETASKIINPHTVEKRNIVYLDKQQIPVVRCVTIQFLFIIAMPSGYHVPSHWLGLLNIYVFIIEI